MGPRARRRAPAALPVLVAGALLLSGCSSDRAALDPEVVHLQAGAPGEPNVVLSDAPAGELLPVSPFSDADVDFMRDMQVHHQQALAMTALVPSRTDREDVRLLAQRMEISQTGELEQLERMLAEHDALTARAERLHGGHGGHVGHGGHDGDHDHDHSDMPGMLTDAELAAMEAADGDDFVRLFLVGMSRHHEGALVMVERLFATEGAAAEPRLAQFAQHVDSDQRIEIDRMARIWAQLPPE